jgi:hypothetical protein
MGHYSFMSICIRYDRLAVATAERQEIEQIITNTDLAKYCCAAFNGSSLKLNAIQLSSLSQIYISTMQSNKNEFSHLKDKIRHKFLDTTEVNSLYC